MSVVKRISDITRGIGDFRYVPIAFILHRTKQPAFSPISKALVLLLLLGSDRQSRQLIEQRLGLFQIERIEAFGELIDSPERAD